MLSCNLNCLLNGLTPKNNHAEINLTFCAILIIDIISIYCVTNSVVSIHSSPHHQMYPMLMNPPHSPMVAGGSQSSMLSSSPLMSSNSPMLSNNSPLMQYSPYSDVLPSTILPPLGPSASGNQVDDSWGYPMNSAFSSEFCSNYGEWLLYRLHTFPLGRTRL